MFGGNVSFSSGLQHFEISHVIASAYCTNVDIMDVDILINAVKERPALYDKTVKDYANRIVKRNLWSEVCAAVIEDWNTLSEEERKSKGK